MPAITTCDVYQIVGPRASGKTTLAFSLVNTNSKGIYVSPIKPDDFIDNSIKHVENLEEAFAETVDVMHNIQTESLGTPYEYIIVDDVFLARPEPSSDLNILKHLVMNGRHMGLKQVIFTTSYYQSMSPEIRCNIDQIYAGRLVAPDIKRLAAHASIEYSDLYDTLHNLEKYQFYVIDFNKKAWTEDTQARKNTVVENKVNNDNDNDENTVSILDQVKQFLIPGLELFGQCIHPLYRQTKSKLFTTLPCLSTEERSTKEKTD